MKPENCPYRQQHSHGECAEPALGAPAERGPELRIVVDLNRCLGYAQCVPLAPEVLQLNGEEALAYDPNPDDSQRQRVARAVASCPVQAIIAEMDPPADRSTT